MEPIGRVQVDRQKQRTLPELLDGFEELARRFTQCQSSLVSGQPLEGPRREVDSVLSVQAGVFVLIALDQGYLKCSNSSEWNPWARYKAHISELSQIRQDDTDRDKQRSGLPECLPDQNDTVASHYSGGDFVVLEKAEPVRPPQRLQVLGELLQQFEEFLDPFSETGQMAVLTAWSAFLGLEIIPQNEMDFRSDWRNQLPIFFDRSMLDSRTNARHNKNWKAPGKTQDEQFRYCIQARADIYATSCRVIAKLLRAEIERRLSEMGGKVANTTKREVTRPRRSNEELFKAALRKHHHYESDGSVLNFTPISARGIEGLMERAISDTTAARLLKKHFGSVKKYQEACFSEAIRQKLVVLLGDGLHAFGTFDSTKHDAEDSTDADGE